MALNKQVIEVVKSGGILIIVKGLSQKGYPDGENGYKIFEPINSKYRAAIHSSSLWSHGLYSPWNSPGQNTGVGSLSLLQRIFPTQGLNPGLPRCRWILYQLSHKGSPRILEWVAYPFSSRSFQPMNQTGVSCIAGGFVTNSDIREALIATPP